ncbi:hypothetical protein [Geothrix sp.]|jgi:hypothetical protein|uniref:hypothetical protein n=1 Tax=Geothrix sp. TaxID=1962974 RepID=UPI0025BFC958|nr:hypothetical protein [Geothrix sp.]
MRVLSIILILLAALAALFLVDRLGLWAERRGWIYWRKRKSSSNALGSITLELQTLFESGKARHVIEAKREPKKDTPDPGSGSA